MKSISHALIVAIFVTLPTAVALGGTDLTWKIGDIPRDTELKLKRTIKTEANTSQTKIDLSENSNILACFLEHPSENKILHFPEKLKFTVVEVTSGRDRFGDGEVYIKIKTPKDRVFVFKCPRLVGYNWPNRFTEYSSAQLVHLSPLFEMVFPDSPILEIVE